MDDVIMEDLSNTFISLSDHPRCPIDHLVLTCCPPYAEKRSLASSLKLGIGRDKFEGPVPAVCEVETLNSMAAKLEILNIVFAAWASFG